MYLEFYLVALGKFLATSLTWTTNSYNIILVTFYSWTRHCRIRDSGRMRPGVLRMWTGSRIVSPDRKTPRFFSLFWTVTFHTAVAISQSDTSVLDRIVVMHQKGDRCLASRLATGILKYLPITLHYYPYSSSGF